MKFLQRLFGLDKQEELIFKKFDELQSKMMNELSTLKVENNALRNEIAVKDRKIEEITSNLRKQNEADLFLEIKKLEKRILAGEKKETIDLTNYNSMAGLNNMYSAQLGLRQYQGLLGGLGNGFPYR